VAIPDVTFPDPSLDTSSVIVTEPEPADSAPVIGGTSSDGRSVAVNVGVVLPEGVLGESVPLHAAVIANDTPSANKVTYFIVSAPVVESIVKRICDSN
jgi:hypothetical protein